jgi:hypothetical protein
MSLLFVAYSMHQAYGSQSSAAAAYMQSSSFYNSPAYGMLQQGYHSASGMYWQPQNEKTRGYYEIKELCMHYKYQRSRHSSVSVVSGYRLDDQPGRSKGFFLWPLCPDWLWGPPSLLCNGYWGSFPQDKTRPGCDTDHSTPSSVEVKRE